MLRVATAEVVRPRLLERFRAAEHERVLLVAAPGGYGKSIALRHYLAASDEQNIVFQLRPEHRTLLGFARGFMEALGAPDSRIAELAAAYDLRQAEGDAGTQLSASVAEFAGSFDGIIAIDDLHLAQGDAQVVQFLDALVRTCDRTRWILCSRSTAGLPTGTWAIRGDMTLPIDENDLRFTIDEAHEISGALVERAEPTDVAELFAITRGWPTTFAFALRSAAHSADVRQLASATREAMYRYFSEQAYEALSDDERDLLKHIAYLPRIDFDVLSAAGFPTALKKLEDLRARLTFIGIEHPNRYYCHDLFREFLQQRVEGDGSAALRAIHLRIARALEETRNILDALRSYSAAVDEDAILRILQTDGLRFVDTGYTDAVDEAIAALSQPLQDAKSIVSALRGIREFQRGRFDRAEDLLRRSLTDADDPNAAAAVALRLAAVSLNVGRDARSVLLPMVESSNCTLEVRAEAASLLAVSCALQRDGDAARKYMDSAQQAAPVMDSEPTIARVYHRLAVAASEMDLPLEMVEAYSKKAVAHALNCGLHVVAANAYVHRANAALAYDEDLGAIAEYTKKIAELNITDRLPLWSITVLDAVRAMFSGDEALAAKTAAKLQAHETSDSKRDALAVPLRANILAWNGRIAEARRMLQPVLSPECFHMESDLAFNSAVHAMLCAADGSRNEARQSIERALSDAATTTRNLPYVRRQACRARLLCAIAEALLGRRVAARRIVQRTSTEPRDPRTDALQRIALTLCRPQRRDARAITYGLEDLSSAGFGGLSKMLRVAFERSGALDEDVRNADSLTPSELSVLEALARGESPKQIAAESGRSVHTVRTLAQRAAEKLGCSGRQQTIAVARKRGLLKE